MLSLVDRPHPAFAELANDLVRAELHRPSHGSPQFVREVGGRGRDRQRRDAEPEDADADQAPVGNARDQAIGREEQRRYGEERHEREQPYRQRAARAAGDRGGATDEDERDGQERRELGAKLRSPHGNANQHGGGEEQRSGGVDRQQRSSGQAPARHQRHEGRAAEDQSEATQGVRFEEHDRDRITVEQQASRDEREVKERGDREQDEQVKANARLVRGAAGGGLGGASRCGKNLLIHGALQDSSLSWRDGSPAPGVIASSEARTLRVSER